MHIQTEKITRNQDFRVISTSKESSFQISSNRPEVHHLNKHVQHVNHKESLNSMNHDWVSTMHQYDTLYWG